ncbi:DUF6518 family protein [Streptomyces sp. NPDC056486]|uniref:DUF6518 family protein n=1 Tax=Streptomyces sp. NPDC056486 TaxID=3345835 RepID=UPI0036B3B92F
MKIISGGFAIGVAFGAATALVNALSSPYSELGMPLTGTVVGMTAKVLSLLFDAGWSWAALAVLTGWLARSLTRGAVVGALSLVGATVAYYVTDATVADAGTDTGVWVAVGVPFGLVLGALGSAIRRPGAIGLLAALVVPAGAAAQMIVMPPRPHLTITPSIVVAEVIVWTCAVLGTAWAVRRFWTQRNTAATV